MSRQKFVLRCLSMEFYRFSHGPRRRLSATFPGPVGGSERGRVRMTLFLLSVTACITTLVMSPNIVGGAKSPAINSVAGAPVLLTRGNSTRGIALDSVTNVAEPFQPKAPVAFGSDTTTHLMLFATNLTL